MTDFPNDITNDEAELFLQISIGGDESGSKFANNKNNAGVGSQTGVTGTALWNYIYHQGKGSGVNDTNYVYGRNADGNVKDLLATPNERIFYNPVGDGTNDTYGHLNDTLTGVVNHGLYTHWRRITVNDSGINKIEALKQSFLTTNDNNDTEIYGTSDDKVELISGALPSSSNNDYSGLLQNDLPSRSYRLDTKSAVSTNFSNDGYLNDTFTDNLGSASYHLGGMYDLLIDTPNDFNVGKFGNDGVFNGSNDKGPIIGADKFEKNVDENQVSKPESLSKGKCFIPRMVINNSPLLTSFDINLSVGQTPENGFVDSNVVNDANDVLALNKANVKIAVNDSIDYNSVHLSPLADSKLLSEQFGVKKATNTPNTVPGEIVAFNIDATDASGAGTFHGVKIPITPPGVHLGGMGLRGIVLIAKRILANKGVVVTHSDYGIYNYVTNSGSDNTKFARLIAGVMNKIGQENTVDTGSELAVINDAVDLESAFANDKDKFLNPFNLELAGQATTMGRRAYNAFNDSPNDDAACFDQYLGAIAGAFLGAGIFLPSGNDWENFFDGVNDGGTGNDDWMNATSATGFGSRSNMSSNFNDFPLPNEITAAHMGELVRGIYDATCNDIPDYLGDGHISKLEEVKTALQRELTLFKVDGNDTNDADRLVHISVDDLEYGYSNAKPGMPFFRKGFNTSGALDADPWKQSVLYSGNLGKGFTSGVGEENQDDMLYDGGLPPPNRSKTVVAGYDQDSNFKITTTWGSTNSVKDATNKDELVMNFNGFVTKTTQTGNNFSGYPYQLDYFSTTQGDRDDKYGKPKYRWAYYYSNDNGNTTKSGGVFL